MFAQEFQNSLPVPPTEARERRLALQDTLRMNLIGQRTQEIAAVFADPEVKVLLEECLKATLAKMLGDVDFSDEEVATIREASLKELTSPAYLMQLATESAAADFRSAAEIREMLERKFAAAGLLKEEKVAELGEDFRELWAGTHGFTERGERMVSRLADIAEEEGLAEATSPRRVREVIRELYPTAADYAKVAQERIDAAVGWVNKVIAILRKCGQPVEEIEVALQPGIEVSKVIFQRELALRIKEIYGV